MNIYERMEQCKPSVMGWLCRSRSDAQYFDEAWQELLLWTWRRGGHEHLFSMVDDFPAHLCARVKKIISQKKSDHRRRWRRSNTCTWSEVETDHRCNGRDPLASAAIVKPHEVDEIGMDELTSIQREALTMSLRGFNATQIAEMEGIGVQAAKSRVKAARRRFHIEVSKHLRRAS